MNARKLLIAESAEDFRIALADALRQTYCVRQCSDGAEALCILRDFQPDVLVLDLMLPGLDGITVLKEAAREGLRPMVLITSPFFPDYALDTAAELGVGYLIRKPCEIRAMTARIGDLSQRLAPPAEKLDAGANVSDLLLSLGMQTKYDGYSYLREAIPMMAADPHQAITKELYPAVGKRFHRGPKSVEHSIRKAIERAWENRDEQVWSRYFPPDSTGHIPRPTNAAFITRLANFRKPDPNGIFSDKKAASYEK